MKMASLFGFIMLMLLASGPAALAAPPDQAHRTNNRAPQRTRPVVPPRSNDQNDEKNIGRYRLYMNDLGSYWKIDTVTGETWSYSLGQWVKMGE